jgi:hypothetical protein
LPLEVFVRRILFAGLLATLFAGCNNAANTTPAVTVTPTPAPTASPVPTATPVPPKSENYFPITNQATYSGNGGGSGFMQTGPAPLAISPSLGTACSASLGTFGDFQASPGAAQAIVPYTDIAFNANNANIVVSKNAAGDVYVVGTFTGGVETCTSPYPIAKAQMVKGTGWTFVDVAGVSRTAVVVSDHATATFTAPVSSGGPITNVSTTYTGVVSEVTYGTDQTIYWAAGYGPVQTINTTTLPNRPSPWTASGWTLDPTSKSKGRAQP